MDTNKLAWLTDIHLNFLDSSGRKEFYKNVAKTNPDAILITGDIAEAHNLAELLTEFSRHVVKPIYFVLGNHDYYFGAVDEVRAMVRQLCQQESNLHWLGDSRIITLNPSTILLGLDGWADARHGNFDQTPLQFNDSVLIKELAFARMLGHEELRTQMQALADIDANTLDETLNSSIDSSSKKVIIATHVPPFPECCWYHNTLSSQHWQPFLVSKATGDVIVAASQKYSQAKFLVLCGHTHKRSAVNYSANIEVRVGKAQYRFPEIEELIQVEK